MIWLCVFPTLTALNLTLGGWLESMSSVVRTFVLATIAVPIVIYGLMPHLHRARARLLASRARDVDATVARRARRARERLSSNRTATRDQAKGE